MQRKKIIFFFHLKEKEMMRAALGQGKRSQRERTLSFYDKAHVDHDFLIYIFFYTEEFFQL